MTKYIMPLMKKTSNDKKMTDKKPELSDAMKKNWILKSLLRIQFQEQNLQ